MTSTLRSRWNFIDAVRLYLRGGYGGSGLPKYGGIGGTGGNVYVEGTVDPRNLFDLRSLRKCEQPIAGAGRQSSQFSLVGCKGADIVIPVPPSTVCTNDAGILIGEVDSEGDRVLVAKGGDGGSPTNGFLGQKGEHHHVKLTIKTISDVGLVGFPNAGKSTILRAMACSRFKPRIAAYPFTTLSPLLGQMQYPDFRSITIVDLPGLIEEAHANKGLGHAFLRHVERTKLILLMVDVQGFQLDHKSPQRNALETVMLLNKELELYDPLLVYKPVMLVVNKMDTKGASAIYDKLLLDLDNIKEILPTLPEEMRPKQFLQLKEVAGISAKKNQKSVNYVKDKVRMLLDLYTDSLCDDTSSDLVTINSSKDIQVFSKKLKEHNVKLI